MMNEGALKTIEAIPLNALQAMQTRLPTTTAGNSPQPWTISIAVMHADRPIAEPTEMSKLPETIRIVAPAATRPRTEISWKMLARFWKRQKRAFADPA